jgi:hypothetical protein
MRTTVTLDPDVEAVIRAAMRERGISFKEALNEAVRRGLAPARGEPFRTRTFAMGRPTVPLTKALALASELEDEEIVRKLSIGK